MGRSSMMALVVAAFSVTAFAQETDDLRPRVAVIELVIHAADDLIFLGRTDNTRDAPATVEDGVLWLGPVATRAVRWRQEQPGVALQGAIDGYGAIATALLTHLVRSGPTRSETSDRVLLADHLPPAPQAPLPEALVLDFTAPALDFDMPILWPDDWSWHLDDVNLVVDIDGTATSLAPGGRLDLPARLAELPLSILAYESVPLGENPDAPEQASYENGTVQLVTTLTVIWRGRLPLEIVE